MWLTGRLAPDFKTIADFRKDNGVAIRAVCAQFVGLCRRLKLFTHAVVAIDGSKFKAVNNRDKNYTVAKVTGRMEQVDASIARYLRALDRADREEGDVAEAKSVRLKEKIAGLRRQMQALEGDGADGSGRARPAGLADRSRRPFDGDQRQRHRHRRLQCADRRRRRAPSDRGPRGDQSGVRPPPACAHGVQAQQATGCEQITAWPTAATSTATRSCRAKARASRLIVPKTLTSRQHKRGLFTGRTSSTTPRRSLHCPPASTDRGHGPDRPLGRTSINTVTLTACLTCPSQPRCTRGGKVKAGQALETRRRP
jgi:BMFP domain-containing protein YqiC